MYKNVFVLGDDALLIYIVIMCDIWIYVIYVIYEILFMFLFQSCQNFSISCIGKQILWFHNYLFSFWEVKICYRLMSELPLVDSLRWFGRNESYFWPLTVLDCLDKCEIASKLGLKQLPCIIFHIKHETPCP